MTFSGQLSKKQLEAIRKSGNVRKKLAYDSHLLFFSIYFSHYIKYAFAPFHYKMFENTEEKNVQMVALTAFRDSGKSTIYTTSFPIWAIVGTHKKHHVVIASQTQAQAKKHLLNVRKELEDNYLLKNDIGPFKEESTNWTSDTLVLSKYNAKITAISTEQSIRGARYGEYRPDLIICDDVEDSNSVKTMEQRDKTWEWFNNEIVTLGSKNLKIIVVGNLLHEDSLIMRLKNKGYIYFEFPLLDEDENIAWLGKFPTWKDIEILKASIPSETAWYKEYLLKIIPDEDRIVKREEIHYYDELPDLQKSPPRLIAVGTDLASSLGKNADFTTIVSAYVTGFGKDLKVYILPQIVNKRLTFPQTVDELKRLNEMYFFQFKRREIVYVEKIAYQECLSQQLKIEGLFSESVPIGGLDKKTRLSIASPYISSARILFPNHGAEELINQIVNFGIEKHDDLVDALTIMVLKIIENDRPSSPKLRYDEVIPPEDRPIVSISGMNRALGYTADEDIMSKQF